MDKKIMILIVSIFLFLGYISNGFSMGDRPPKKKDINVRKGAELSTEALQAAGNVTAVDKNKATLVVLTKNGKSVSFVIDSKTIFSKGAKSAKLTDIKKGDFAAVTYEIIHGKNIAKSVSFFRR